MQFKLRTSIFARQILATDFLVDHPNENHIPGVIYSNRLKTAFTTTGSNSGSGKVLKAGDWYVKVAGTELVMSDEEFQFNFAPQEEKIYLLQQDSWNDDAWSTETHLVSVHLDFIEAKRTCDELNKQEIETLVKAHGDSYGAYRHSSNFWLQEAIVIDSTRYRADGEIYRPQEVNIGDPNHREPQLYIDWSTDPPTQKVR